MINEAELLKLIQTEALKFRCILYRNNSAAFKDSTGRIVRAGLGNISKKLWDNFKTSDLIGYTIITVTPDMVGREIPVFTAIEVKLPTSKKDARYKAQEKFINQVTQDGGLGGIIYSLDSLNKLFKDFFNAD